MNDLAQATSQAKKLNMELMGYLDQQGRSAYQPLVHAQGGPWINYIGLYADDLSNPSRNSVYTLTAVIRKRERPQRVVSTHSS